MPFVTLRSEFSPQVVQFSGMQLATGETIIVDDGSLTMPVSVSVLVSLLAAIAAAIVGLSAYGWRHILNAMLGAVSLGGLVFFLDTATGSFLGSQAETGLFGSILLIAAGSGLSVFLALDAKRSGQHTLSSAAHSTPSGDHIPLVARIGPRVNFCSGCGSATHKEDRFCITCGQNLLR